MLNCIDKHLKKSVSVVHSMKRGGIHILFKFLDE